MRELNTVQKVWKATRKNSFQPWRDHYEEFSFTDLIWLNNGIYNFFSSQNSANKVLIEAELHQIIEKVHPVEVLELGCWQGHLAQSMLKKFRYEEIARWVGFDINYYALDNTVVSDPRYFLVKLIDWFSEVLLNHYFWEKDRIFIAACTFEHMSKDDIVRIAHSLKTQDVRSVIVEMPFREDNWKNYKGSHVFEGNAEDIETIFDNEEFELVSKLLSGRRGAIVFRWEKK